MKKPCFLALAVCASLIVFVPSADATSVDVRVEGATQTLFEGPVETTPHLVRASSDTSDRTCDGTNNDAFPTPGPTAIGALDDAASLGGFDWDAQWSAVYDEYFISRIGPDAEDNDNFYYWGGLHNGDFTSVGGCETVVADGDEVLWAYDAFSKTKALQLTGPDSIPTGDPVEVNVSDTIADAPVQGASVGGQTTDAAGNATLSFDQADLVELKATAPSSIRSNRLDLCVQDDPADDCASDPPVDPPVDPGAPPAGAGGAAATPPVQAAVAVPKVKRACAGRSGNSLKRCKALNKCKKLKGKKKRAKCRAKARKIGRR